MADKSLREFSAPTTTNICTGPAVDINGSFELKPALINMVQASQFFGKAHEDASAHLQYFLEICSTFTIKDVPRDAILLCLFPIPTLGESKAVVLRQQGEEYYMGIMFHQFPGEILSHRQNQCSSWEDSKLLSTT